MEVPCSLSRCWRSALELSQIRVEHHLLISDEIDTLCDAFLQDDIEQMTHELVLASESHPGQVRADFHHHQHPFEQHTAVCIQKRGYRFQTRMRQRSLISS